MTAGQREGESGMATGAPDPPSRSPKAGRDLPAAIAVGVTLGAAIIVSLLTLRQLFLGIVALAVVISSVELAGALRRGAGVRVSMLPVLVGGQAMLWLTWPFGLTGLFVAFTITALGCLGWRLREGVDGYLRDVTASVFTAAYVPMFAAFAGMLVRPEDGALRVLCFMIGVVASDTGGYALGVLLGRTPMAPKVSPKK